MALTNSELFVEIMKSPRPHRIVDFPRNNPSTGESLGKLALWILTPSEHVQAAGSAEEYCRSLLGVAKLDERSAGRDSIYETAVTSEILFRACRRAEDLKLPLFPSSADVRAYLTGDEVAVLVSAYAEMQSELGPIKSQMGELEMDAWVARLTAGADAVAPFYLLSSEMKNDLIRHLAAQLRNSRRFNTGSGIPVESSISDA